MIKIGTSGFSFPDWKGTVYPARLSNKEMLSYYAYTLKFDTVEINFTYYTLPNPGHMEIMSDKVPEAEKMGSKVQKVYTFFNNCHAGFALRNALSFKRMLGSGGKDLEGILPHDRVSDSIFGK